MKRKRINWHKIPCWADRRKYPFRGLTRNQARRLECKLWRAATRTSAFWQLLQEVQK